MIYFLIPLYNEELNIDNLQKNLSSVLKNLDSFIVFSDDGSTDKSVELIKSKFDNDNIKILENKKNHGPGYAFNRGFDWIIKNSKNDNDKIVTLEADSTSDLSILDKMLKINMLGYNLVLASIYVQGGGFDKTSLFRKVISSSANLIFRFVFDIKVQTLSSFYRVYDISLIKKIKSKYGNISSQNGFICKLDILLRSIKLNANIIEIPMVLKSKNRIGKSKLKILKTTSAYLKFLLKNKIYKK
mgnify:CR=1 FL=1|tara:strand:+ start:1437 stop:2165 length:729 start_codon:yes stop_codon:yes gene_type:complete